MNLYEMSIRFDQTYPAFETVQALLCRIQPNRKIIV